MIYFITGNKHKFTEAQAIIPELKRLDLDLLEIQELDPRKIIEAKIPKYKTSIVVEDVSLEIEKLNGLPGPLVKWFIKTIGPKGIFNLAPDSNAQRIAMLGYKTKNTVHYFSGVTKGTIVAPRGKNGFGFDAIFQPTDSDKTFAQMSLAEKSRFSHRAKAFRKLKKFLQAL